MSRAVAESEGPRLGSRPCGATVRPGRRTAWLALLALQGVACSALVSPDPSRLGAQPLGGPGSSADGGGSLDAGSDCLCDDLVACTFDECAPSGGCLHTPDDSQCAPDERCNPDSGCVSQPCTVDEDCDDGNLCTQDLCEQSLCRYPGLDADGDGEPASSVAGVACESGRDCNDGNAGVFTGAPELCNSVDDNCDGQVDEGCMGAPPVGNDACPNATTISFAGRTETVTTQLGGATLSHTTTCSAGGADVVYAIEIEETVDIVIDATQSPTPVILAANTQCSTAAFAQRCTEQDEPARLWLHRISPSQADVVYLLVQARSSDARGTAQFTISVSPAAEDGCDAPLDITGGGTVLGFMESGLGLLLDRFQGSCSSGGPGMARVEAVFQAGQRGGSARLTAQSNDFLPQMYVRRQCQNAQSELVCRTAPAFAGNSLEITAELPKNADRFTLFLDGADPGEAYELHYKPL